MSRQFQPSPRHTGSSQWPQAPSSPISDGETQPMPVAHAPQVAPPPLPPPLPPLPHHSPRRKSPALNRNRTPWLLLGVALCVVVALTAFATLTRGSSPRPAATSQVHVTQPVSRPATTTPRVAASPSTGHSPTQTRTVSNPTSGQAVLGGDLAAFIARYGRPNDHSAPASGLYRFQSYPGSNLDALAVTTDLTDGSVYAGRAESVTVQAPAAAWSQQQAGAACAAYFPRDAVYKQQIALADGYDRIYYAASLAQLFPVSAFADFNGKQVQPGLFDVHYVYRPGTKMIASCGLLIGTQQTQL